ncbi:MAG: GNAT family N-acetyltransferase [Sedimentisphaerales bacterium]|nr:GNAT family N-acetyltransferase [Sedimentisphaerales bacterium]
MDRSSDSMFNWKSTISEREDIHDKIEVRQFGDADSVSDLVDLLHRGYERLAQSGLKYLAATQNEEVTLRRIKNGECYIAMVNGRMIGTILFHRPPANGKLRYGRQGVAKFSSFAVDPQFYGLGVGSMLLDVVECRAREIGSSVLACDTAVQAKQLIQMYARRGYRPSHYVSWSNTNYYSIIMTKPVGPMKSRRGNRIKCIAAICLYLRRMKCMAVVRRDGQRRLWVRLLSKFKSIPFGKT